MLEFIQIILQIIGVLILFFSFKSLFQYKPKIKCRVAWMIRNTGHKGHGEWTNQYLAKLWADYGNRSYKGSIIHWVEYDQT